MKQERQVSVRVPEAAERLTEHSQASRVLVPELHVHERLAEVDQ